MQRKGFDELLDVLTRGSVVAASVVLPTAAAALTFTKGRSATSDRWRTFF